MVNLEKLTGRIISDAEEYARGILDSAKSDIAELEDAARAKIEYIHAESDSRAEKESKAMLDRAAAASESASRAIILSAKTKLLDSAFEAALSRLKQLAVSAPADYKNLLVRLLVSVISSAAESETAHDEYYGSGELVSHELYTAAFCVRDLEGGSGSVASQVIAEASKKLSGTGKKLRAADNAADIDGGFILRSGDVEYNCSFSALMAGYRSEHEGEIYRMLFE
jgi:Archaeal/vacuolar-type H+-ATPase subunit E